MRIFDKRTNTLAQFVGCHGVFIERKAERSFRQWGPCVVFGKARVSGLCGIERLG